VNVVEQEWKRRGNSGVRGVEGLHYWSKSSSEWRMIQAQGKYMIQTGEHQKESIIRNMSHGEQGRKRRDWKRGGRAAGSERGCRSDWRERRSSELRGKEEKKAILSHSPWEPLCISPGDC